MFLSFRTKKMRGKASSSFPFPSLWQEDRRGENKQQNTQVPTTSEMRRLHQFLLQSFPNKEDFWCIGKARAAV